MDVAVDRSGNLFYIHDAPMVDRVRHYEGCVITDETEAWGVKMKPEPERPPSGHPDSHQDTPPPLPQDGPG